ncbi:MAG: hypothetical protein F6K28_37005 [Microcoleus sp. SIO2G3]|nr:hypothetical protein [Microcoleus sp. SIO2G3]
MTADAGDRTFRTDLQKLMQLVELIAAIAAPISTIAPLRADEILTVRSLIAK